MSKRKLAASPTQENGRWLVHLPCGGVDAYNCKLDACLAQMHVAEALARVRQLAALKRLWASELAAAARSRAARFGHVHCELTCLPETLKSLLVQQATEGCSACFAIFDVGQVREHRIRQQALGCRSACDRFNDRVLPRRRSILALARSIGRQQASSRGRKVSVIVCVH